MPTQFYIALGYLERVEGDQAGNLAEAAIHFDVAIGTLRSDSAEWVDACRFSCAVQSFEVNCRTEDEHGAAVDRAIRLLSDALTSTACQHAKPQLQLQLGNVAVLHNSVFPSLAVKYVVASATLLLHQAEEQRQEATSEGHARVCQLLAAAVNDPVSSHGSNAFVGFFGNLQVQ